ncbi:MAG TPA: trypsin-like peptidase domain-containing protein [Thermoanaerobaculia bacterium]|nr:trypsin-like peptidase domain-containing protein [Thermoanaerobaculia bacterium]
MTKPLSRSFAVLMLCLLPAALYAVPPRESADLGSARRAALSDELIDQRVLRFVDVEWLQFEDALNARRTDSLRVPERVAEPVSVGYSIDKDGTWENLADGGRLWRLRVSSPGAVFLSFMLAELALPPGAGMSFYSVDREYHDGPYTSAAQNRDKRFGSPAIPGDSAVVEVRVPAGALFEPSLVVESVSHGYRDFQGFSRGPFRDGRTVLASIAEALGACEVDVNCPDGSQWQADKRSVARTYDGRFLCTGALINNATGDCKALFLTANHCVSTSRVASGMVFYWNYESSTCGGGGAPTNQTSTGAALRATNSSSDFTLLELNARPNAAYNVYFAGFNRSASAPSNAVAIHHPTGAAKKISFENDAVQDAGSFSGGWGGTHWRIVGWDVGTTEGGSSGCPLFNPSHQIVGQLHGGTADCSGGWDEFGKLSSSWGLGLAAFLDPNNTGVTSVNGKESSTCSGTGGGCFPTRTACTSNGQCCSGSCPKKTKTCS